MLLPFCFRLLQQWADLARRDEYNHKVVTIALVGKYTKLPDSYASIAKSLQHATIAAGYKLNLNYIEACTLERAYKKENPASYHESWQVLCVADGVVLPGGFGMRGFEGKMRACEWCRKNNKPILGICLGLQAMVVEFAQNVLGLKGANSTEIDETEHPLVIDMPEHCPHYLGGTMRLGKRKTIFKKDCLLSK